MVKTKKANITTTENVENVKEGLVQTAPVPVVKENSEENVVYVYPSKQTEHIPSLSPECLAIETSLRFKKITYKYATSKSIDKPHGEPTIILNQQEHGGVDKIEEAVASLPLGEGQEAVIFPELNADQQADCQAYIYALIDTVLYQALYVQRFKHITSTTAEMDIIKRVKSGFQRLFKVNKDDDRLAKMKPEQLVEIVKDGLKAINNYLKRDSDKRYFFGDKPTKHDAIVFGILAQYWQEPPTANGGSTTDFTLSRLLDIGEGNDNRIIQYLENIKTTYWPDWQDRCAKPPPPPPVVSPSKRGTFRKSKSEQQQQAAVAVAPPLAEAPIEANGHNGTTATNGDAAAEKPVVVADPQPTMPPAVEVKAE